MPGIDHAASNVHNRSEGPRSRDRPNPQDLSSSPPCTPSCDDNEMAMYLRRLSSRFTDSVQHEGPFKCMSCGARASQYREHPIVAANFILNCLFPHCHRGSCERKVTYLAQEDHHRHVRNVFQLIAPPGAIQPEFNLACVVCGSTKTPKKCSRCKCISYCSPTCQKGDWKRHKAECTARMEGSHEQNC